MNESDFNQLIDATLFAIEEAIEQLETDIDYDTVAGILTLEFDNNSKIIINRQSANQQLWLAAKSGGYHFDWLNDQWIEHRSQQTLTKILSTTLSRQAQKNISLTLQIESS